MCNEENRKQRMTSFSCLDTGAVDGKEVRIEIDNKKVSNEQLSTSNTYLMKIKNLKISSISDSGATRGLVGNTRFLSVVSLNGLSQIYSTKSQIHIGGVLVNGFTEFSDLEFIVNDPFQSPFYVTAEIPDAIVMTDRYLAMSFHISFEPL